MTAPDHHLFVCTSCRGTGAQGELRRERSGRLLFESLSTGYAAWARRTGFVVAPQECLSACTRPCTVALRGPGKYVYVFGDLQPRESEAALVECATLYRRSTNGFLPRDERPFALRAGIRSRIPPLEAP